MGMVQRCETALLVVVARRCAWRSHLDDPVTMIKKIPAASTVSFDLAATLVEQRVVGAAQQHEIR